METAVHSALEEICSEGAGGLHLLNLWPKLQSSLASHGLPLCPNVKASLWSNLLNFPGLQFQAQGSSYDSQNASIQSVEKCEQINLKIIASEGLRNSFIGMYDVDASSSSVDKKQRCALERLAIARHNGITQSELAKELKIKGNNMFYILKKLETRGLIVRQSTVVKTKETCSEGEPKNSSNVTTNMVYLYRYAKHLGCQQRIEIVREDKPLADDCDIGDANGANDGGFCNEHVEEDVQVKDFLPALEAICDKLEQADGKVLVVSDIKRDLGYRGSSGHRAWRIVYGKLKAACVVEDCCTKVKDKKVKCLRLLKKFSPKHFEPNSSRQGYDELDPEQPKSEKRGQITDQLVELPIEHQIYDMIDAEGSKGLTITEICKRLGLRNKQYYDRLLDMSTRFGMHLQAESKNRGVVYRVWTSGNFNPEALNIASCYPETVSHEITECDPCPLVWEANNFTPLIQDVDASTSKDVKSADGTAIDLEISYDSTANENDIKMLLPLSTSKNSASEAIVEVSNTELQIESTKSDAAQPETSPALSPSKRRRRSYRRYPCLTLGAASSIREQRILKMLEEEKFLIKPELHRRLENLENLEKGKNSMMDRKTLRRSLDKLQLEGRCKCIVFRIPVVTNCGRSRTTEVVLHPSISNMSPEVSAQIHERLRSFEIQTRRQSTSQPKGMSVPVLDSVERIPVSVHLDSQAEQADARRANGFVLAKMVRTKLLHIFLWGYLSSSPGWDDLLFMKNGHNIKNPHSTSKLFGLDAAIKAMPLELFLQVVGSTQKFEDLVEKCKKGLRLSDLGVQEYRCLMDTRATGRLSWLIDILLRLKLIRLVRAGPADDEDKVEDTTLTHALELKPYIEEPVSTVSLSSGFIFPDLRPHIRHDFVLSTRKVVDEYWSTLEYCYAAANSKAALHAFPGSAVHEIFLPRSWASVRVMTADQRAELLKRLALDEPNKKLSLNECRKISRDLNLTLEQVLRIYQDKRQQRLTRLPGDSYTKTDVIETLARKCSSRKRKRYFEGKSLADIKSASEGGPLNKHSLARASVTNDQLTDRQNSFLKTLGDHESGLLQGLSGDQMQTTEEQESNEENEHDQFFHNCTLSRLKSRRRRRFSWTEEAERQLVIKYVRHRASLGVKFHRTDWGSLSNLPAPPEICRRRMALLNGNLQSRKAVMKLCNMLAERYTKKLEKIQNNLSNLESAGVLVREPIMQRDCNQNVDDCFEHDVELESEECWDNFEDGDIKMVLDDILRSKRMAKLNSSNAVDSGEWSHRQDLYDTESVPSAHLSQEDEVIGHRSKLSARRLRSRRIAQKYNKLLNEGTSISKRVYESVAVSNAAELFKLIFLSTLITPQASTLLAETLRRYSQHDLFAAFSYLRENKIMIGGDGTMPFALSQDFLRSISLSPFPTNTGKRAVKFASWLAEREKDLMEGAVDLPTDLQCGDIFHLFALVSKMELLVTPCLPEEGIGEAEDSRTSKRQIDSSESCGGGKSKRLRASMAGEGEIISRREKGFPGIKLSLSQATIPRMHTLDMFKANDNNGVSVFVEKGQNNSAGLQIGSTSFPPDVCASARVRIDSRDIDQTAAVAHKCPWEAMSSYAELLISSFSHEGSSLLHPELFRTICSAIQKSGDQGLSMKEFSKVLNLSGQKELEIIVDVLEAFGRSFKVCAYDSIHVVDTLYRSKYLLTSVAEAVQIPETNPTNPPVGSRGKHDDEHRFSNVANHEDVSSLQDEMRIDGDDVHRITILNHPKEMAELSSDIQSTTEVEDSTHSDLSARANQTVETVDIHSFDPHLSRPILPWINGDGTINELVYKGLVRRILGIVMQNPGILEDEIIKHMKALNPQSCKKLLEKLILDNHIVVRKMHESSVEPPAILGSIFGKCPMKSKLVCRDHFFANPLSTTLL